MGNCISTNKPPTPGPSPSTETIDSTTTTNRREGKSPLLSTTTNEEGNPNGQILEAPNMIEFGFADLKKCTKNFNSQNLLGGSVSSIVYKGWVGSVSSIVYKGWVDGNTFAPCKSTIGMPIAVKKLESKYIDSFQDFEPMVNFIGRVSHPKLVKFLGYCWEHKKLLFVNEFVQRGSLENHLFSNSSQLSWELRIKIAIGAAQGLDFLHTSENEAAYRVFKVSSILIDGNYNAKLSDFGLVKVLFGGDCRMIAGSTGYLAPEDTQGPLTVKNDVYSFGVVLLELMTGLRAWDKKRPNEQRRLVHWLRPLLSNKRRLKTIMDVRLEGQYSEEAMMLASRLSSQCTEPEPRNRLAMKEVFESLEHVLKV